ncbi:MAG: S1 RNA-binding domain-containing protein [Pseudomonadota bacterium]|nr:S1 RNA-binding domain-containing protein [Pseudomonadota bacterium]
MDEQRVRGILRRKTQNPNGDAAGGDAQPESPTSWIRSVHGQDESGASSRAPAAPELAPPSPRPATDLDGLRSIADMDPAEVAAMMAAFAPARPTGPLRQGQRIRGAISRLTPTLAFVSVGAKADASIDRAELKPDVAMGDLLDAYIVSMKDGDIRLSRSLGGDSTSALLDEAIESKIPVQGKVLSRNEAGFLVLLSGDVKAFCPNSQIDHQPEADLDAYIGRSLAFRVLDVRGREAKVSHRAVAEIEARAAADIAITTVVEGEVYDGVVTGIREFGAFVRITSGVEGLVRLPNLSKKRVESAASAVTEGQAVRVRVLQVDLARKRVDLGIRQVEENDTPMAADNQPRRQESLTTGGTFGTLGALLQDVRVPKKRK